ncbi:unnamed protein product [Blepharisma stoltei]|uniref:Uncharacterized protein n=1 Tax=Blepharisma stoltei TaxID=1481888 RepID=A0AAU9J2B9_9CILI|nr:unnamed protein product [Blepharisma stoltei]
MKLVIVTIYLLFCCISAYSDTQSVGIDLISQFLLEDNSVIKENGGIIDKTGFDGLPAGEVIAQQGTIQRLKQRARSAAGLFARSQGLSSFQSMGAIENNENLKGWKSFNVMLMGTNDYQVVQVCLPEIEQKIVLVIPQNDRCGPKIQNVEASLGTQTKSLFEGNFGGLAFPGEIFKNSQVENRALNKLNPADEIAEAAQNLKSLFSKLALEAQSSIGKIEEAMKRVDEQNIFKFK